MVSLGHERANRTDGNFCWYLIRLKNYSDLTMLNRVFLEVFYADPTESLMACILL